MKHCIKLPDFVPRGKAMVTVTFVEADEPDDRHADFEDDLAELDEDDEDYANFVLGNDDEEEDIVAVGADEDEDDE